MDEYLDMEIRIKKLPKKINSIAEEHLKKAIKYSTYDYAGCIKETIALLNLFQKYGV